jgi:hypothetical protein
MNETPVSVVSRRVHVGEGLGVCVCASKLNEPVNQCWFVCVRKRDRGRERVSV